MSVDTRAGKPSFDYDGTPPFLQPRCRDKFAADPEHYIEQGRKSAAAGGGHSSKLNASTPARWTPKSYKRGRAPAPCAAWRWSRWACPVPSRAPARTYRFSPPLEGGAHLHGTAFHPGDGPHVGLPLHDWLGRAAANSPNSPGAARGVLVRAADFHRGLASFRNRSPNMWTLIMLGTGAAFLYSLAAVFAPWLFPEPCAATRGTVPVYFEAAAVIVVLVLLGQVLELRARARTGDALRALLDLAPKTAIRVSAEGRERRCRSKTSCTATACASGQAPRFPLTAFIVSGTAAIDKSLLWARHPRRQEAGRHRHGRHAQHDGSFVMEARAVGSETVLSRIVALVAEAQRSRAPLQIWPIAWRATSCPPWSLSRCSRFWRGSPSAPRRSSPTPSSPPSRCSSSPARARWGSRRPSQSWWRPAAARAKVS